MTASSRDNDSAASRYAWIDRWLDVQSTWKVALLTFAWLASTTWMYPLLLPDEGRYVGVAWQMLQSGDPLVPRLDGLPFFHKPPLFYWLTQASLWLLGTNEWAGRMASVLSGTVIVASAFWFLRTHASQRLAAAAALILAVLPFLFGGAHYANLDMTVAAAITATIVVGATAVLRCEAGQAYRRMLVLTYALAGLGFLAKGLIGVVLPGGVLFFWLLGRRRFDTMGRMLWLPGVAVFLLVAAPWMIAMQWRYPGFFDYYIVYHHFQRFLEASFNNQRPFWFYVPVLLALALPWSLRLWRLRHRMDWIRAEHAAIRGLMVSWLLVVVIFFSLPASKLVGYVLPAVVPLVFFVADSFTRALQGNVRVRAQAQRAFAWMLAGSVAICLAAAATMTFAPQPSSKALAHALAQQYQPGDTLVMMNRYRYDVPFYLGHNVQAVVVDDWTPANVMATDNWRKELFEAARFDPALGSRLLIDPAQLRERLCQPRAQAVWLMIERRNVERHAFLADWPAPVFADDTLRLWRVPAPQALTFCGETPRAAQE